MNKRFSLFITAAAMLVCFANAQTAEPAPTSEPVIPSVEQAAPAEEAAAQEQVPETVQEENATAPAPVEAPAPDVVSQPVPEEAAPLQEQAPEAVRGGEFPSADPVDSPAPDVVYQPAQEPQPAPVAVASQPAIPAHKLIYGARASIGTTEYIGESVDDLEDGITWDAGFFVSFPLTEHTLSAELGLDVLYRDVSRTKSTYRDPYTGTSVARKDRITGYSLSIPLTLDLFTPTSNFYFAFGTQIEIPLKNQLKISFDGNTIVDQNLAGNQCAPMSWDFVLGVGFLATNHFGIDLRLNIGISDIYDDLYVDKEYWGYTPVDLNIGVKFFL